MKYKSFRIQNFKGIKDTTIQLESIAGASVFAFVGLNESGKTTVLEAIHSFAPDVGTRNLLGDKDGIAVPVKERVPRHLISDFTGDVSVTATVTVTQPDKEYIAREILEELDLILNIESFPDEVTFERKQTFKNGDLYGGEFLLHTKLQLKPYGQRKWRDPVADEKQSVTQIVYERTPDIAYFPTFVFDFPDIIYLTDRGGAVDRFYRRVFQDILDYDGRGQTIEKDIVGRVRRKDMVLPWVSFLPAWNQHDGREKIQHVMDRAGAAVTKLIFGRWNKIFREDTKGKEVIISLEIIEGEKTDSQGTKTKTQEHDVVVKFQIRDGTRRFNVNDRSLGFRWFFSFMLFTQFRVARLNSNSRPLLFLFDEPASNLHAAAQQKLIESFPEIAREEHVLAYSTHSHYMIEPKWLEQTFIVRNRADDPALSVLDEISLDDESLDIQVSTYRSFVNDHPGQTSYFQPILDRLEVIPSRFDARKASIVLEGKSDYYILRYASRLLHFADLPLLPGLGAGTFGALAALHVGWNLNFLFVLDGDKQGRTEQGRYAEEFGIPPDRLVTLDTLVSGLTVIESLFDNEARQIIQESLQLKGQIGKSQLMRFCQERVSADKLTDLGPNFSAKGRALLQALHTRLEIKL